MRELFDGNLSGNIRGVALADSTTAINILEHLQQCEHPAAAIRNLLCGHKVTIRRITSDRYGRTVAELFLNGSNVQQQLVASGHASICWRYANQYPWIL